MNSLLARATTCLLVVAFDAAAMEHTQHSTTLAALLFERRKHL